MYKIKSELLISVLSPALPHSVIYSTEWGFCRLHKTQMSIRMINVIIDSTEMGILYEYTKVTVWFRYIW